MNMVRPIWDLQENFSEISKFVLEEQETVLLTNQGRGDMVILSKETFDNWRNHSEICLKLQEAQEELYSHGKRYTEEEASRALEAIIEGVN